MGYYTEYWLSCEPFSAEIIQEFLKKNQEAQECLTEDGRTNISCKWYDHQEDLK